MTLKYIYPKNKEHFKKLVILAKKVLSLCQKNKIYPTIYGSFVHFFHTKDGEMNIHDLDILIKEKEFQKLPAILEKAKIKFRFYSAGMIIKKENLKIELDKMEKEYNSPDHPFFKNTNKIDFYGIKTNILSLKQLEDLYKLPLEGTKEGKAKMRKKIKHLENFLGRKLK